MKETLALVPIPQRFTYDAPGNSRPEIVAVVEPVNRIQHVLPRETGVLQVRKLMAARIRDRFARQKTLAHTLIVKLRAWVSMSHRNLNRLAIEFLREIDGLLDGFLRFTRQSDDEIAVDMNANLLAILHKGAPHLNRNTLFDVL